MPRRAPSAVEPLGSRRLRAVDLVVQPYPSFGEVGPEIPFTGGFGLSNRGTTATARTVPFRVVLRVADADGAKTDIRIGDGSTDARLGAKGGTYVQFSFTLPGSVYGRSGELFVIVDPANRIRESNETNNAQAGLNARVRVENPFIGDTLTGTEQADAYKLSQVGDELLVTDLKTKVTRTAPVASLPTLKVVLGGGDDLLRVDASVTLPLEVDCGSGNDTVGSGIRIGGGGGTAGSGDDTIDGGFGNDLIYGGAGDDSLLGGDGSDTLNAGAGDDFAGGGNVGDWITGGDGDDTLAGDGGGDYIRGDAGDNRIAGNGGHDHLKGGDGNDTMLGGTGRDRMTGYKGVDRLLGGGGQDWLRVDVVDDGVDTLDGGDGFDEAYVNATALLAGIEFVRPL